MKYLKTFEDVNNYENQYNMLVSYLKSLEKVLVKKASIFFKDFDYVPSISTDEDHREVSNDFSQVNISDKKSVMVLLRTEKSLKNFCLHTRLILEKRVDFFTPQKSSEEFTKKIREFIKSMPQCYFKSITGDATTYSYVNMDIEYNVNDVLNKTTKAFYSANKITEDIDRSQKIGEVFLSSTNMIKNKIDQLLNKHGFVKYRHRRSVPVHKDDDSNYGFVVYDKYPEPKFEPMFIEDSYNYINMSLEDASISFQVRMKVSDQTNSNSRILQSMLDKLKNDLIKKGFEFKLMTFSYEHDIIGFYIKYNLKQLGDNLNKLFKNINEGYDSIKQEDIKVKKLKSSEAILYNALFKILDQFDFKEKTLYKDANFVDLHDDGSLRSKLNMDIKNDTNFDILYQLELSKNPHIIFDLDIVNSYNHYDEDGRWHLLTYLSDEDFYTEVNDFVSKIKEKGFDVYNHHLFDKGSKTARIHILYPIDKILNIDKIAIKKINT